MREGGSRLPHSNTKYQIPNIMTCTTIDGFTLEEAVVRNDTKAHARAFNEGVADLLKSISTYQLHGLTEKDIVSRLKKLIFTKSSNGLTAWVRDAIAFVKDGDDARQNSTRYGRIVEGLIDLSLRNH
jgi:hypothetical protein